jgi:hypothetical protein
MTSVSQQLASDALAAISQHKEVINDIDRVSRIAKCCSSIDEVGSVLLEINDGDWEATQAYIKTLKEGMDSIFLTWTIAARLEFFEKRGEKK